MFPCKQLVDLRLVPGDASGNSAEAERCTLKGVPRPPDTVSHFEQQL